MKKYLEDSPRITNTPIVLLLTLVDIAQYGGLGGLEYGGPYKDDDQTIKRVDASTNTGLKSWCVPLVMTELSKPQNWSRNPFKGTHKKVTTNTYGWTIKMTTNSFAWTKK